MPENELTRVHERLDGIAGDMSDIAGDIREINATCSVCREQVARHDKMLVGNSGGGLGTRMAVAEDGLKRLHESKTKWYWMFIGSAFAFVVTVLASLSAAIASGVFRE